MSRILGLCLVFFPIIIFGQLSVSNTITNYTIDFDNALAGILAGAYSGTGFNPIPVAGQMDSDGIKFSAVRNGPTGTIAFGETSSAGEAANNTSIGGTVTNGFFAFETSNGGPVDYAFGWQSANNVFAGGSITLKLDNNTGADINNLAFDYVFKEFNDQSTSNGVTVSYSLDDNLYTPLNDLAVTSVGTAAASPSWNATPLSTVINLVWTAGTSVYIRFTSTDLGNSAYDEVALDDLSFTAYSEEYLYNGTSWTPSEPIGALGAENAYVASGATSIISSSTTLNRVRVEAGASLSVQTGLTVNDTLFIEASSVGQGQVLGPITGTTQFQSLHTSATPRWFNFAAPVNGALNQLEFESGGFIQTLADVANDSSKVNIWYYDETLDNAGQGTWRPLADQTGAINAAGYSIYLGAPYFGSLPIITKAHGTLSNGIQNIPITKTAAGAGYNFVGNPFATSIDFDAVEGDNNTEIAPVYYIYDDEADGYITYSAPLGTPSSRRYIGPGQAFFVQSNLASTSLVINTSSQIMSEVITNARAVTHPFLQLAATGTSGKIDNAYLALNSAASDNFDPTLDGIKMMNPGSAYPNLYTVIGGEVYVFNFINDQFNKRTVPLNFEMAVDDNVTIDANLIGLEPGMSLILEDKLSGDMINLRNQRYTFRHLAANPPDRFVLHLDQSSVNITQLAADKFTFFVTNDLLQIVGDLNKDHEIMLFDLSGKLVRRVDYSKFAGGMEVGQLKSGVYILSIAEKGTIIFSDKLLLEP